MATAKVCKDGVELDAEFAVEVFGDGLTAVFESHSGARGKPTARNVDFAAGFELALRRLGRLRGVIVDALVDTARTQHLTVEERRVHVRGRSYPIAVAEAEPGALRQDIAAALRDAGKPLAERTYQHRVGANKRLRLFLEVPGFDPITDHAEQLQEQLRGAFEGHGNPFPPDPDDPELTLEAFKAAVANKKGDTDAVTTGHRRVEQGYLRKRLLAGRAAAPCALCGRVFPQGFLVAAHIKPRSKCTDDERLDIGNIAMLACRFGCDTLYEYGYVYVDEVGLIQGRSGAAIYPSTKAGVARCEGRPCEAWTPTSEPYFRWHRDEVAGIPTRPPPQDVTSSMVAAPQLE